MRKTYWGYLLLGFVVAGLLGNIGEQQSSRERTNMWIGALMFGIPGVLLTKSGRETDNKVKRFTDVFFSLKSNGDPLSSVEIQKRAGLSAADVYKSKTIAEKRGLLPYGSELV